MVFSLTISIVTLIMKGLSNHVKGRDHIKMDFFKRKDLTIFYPQETLHIQRLKVKGWKNVHHIN